MGTALIVVLDVLLDSVYKRLNGFVLVKVTDLRLEISEEALDDAIVIAVPLNQNVNGLELNF